MPAKRGTCWGEGQKGWRLEEEWGRGRRSRAGGSAGLTSRTGTTAAGKRAETRLRRGIRRQRCKTALCKIPPLMGEAGRGRRHVPPPLPQPPPCPRRGVFHPGESNRKYGGCAWGLACVLVCWWSRAGYNGDFAGFLCSYQDLSVLFQFSLERGEKRMRL